MTGKSVYAWLLVAGQFGFLAAIILTGHIAGCNLTYKIIQLLSLVLVFWAVIVMKLHTLHVSPEVRSTARLVKAGPYAIIRHPMYTSLLMYTIPLIVCEFTYLRLTLLILLTGNLILKLYFEESLLKKHFPDYPDYMKKTYRLVPFVY